MAKKNGNSQTTALATIDQSRFAIAQAGSVNLQEILTANLGAEGLQASDMDRISVPSGGGLQWEIPGLEGDEMVNELEGVIVHWKSVRVYWQDSIDDGGAGNPPDCYSEDGITGHGEPGGECDDCPFAQFKSAKGGEGRGQACKMVRQLFLIREHDMLPLIVNAPPSSLKDIRKYFNRLSSHAKPYYSVVTKLSLQRETNKDGIKYSVVKPSVAAILDEKAAAFFRELQKTFLPHLAKVPVDGSEYHNEDAA